MRDDEESRELVEERLLDDVEERRQPAVVDDDPAPVNQAKKDSVQKWLMQKAKTLGPQGTITVQISLGVRSVIIVPVGHGTTVEVIPGGTYLGWTYKELRALGLGVHTLSQK